MREQNWHTGYKLLEGVDYFLLFSLSPETPNSVLINGVGWRWCMKADCYAGYESRSMDWLSLTVCGWSGAAYWTSGYFDMILSFTTRYLLIISLTQSKFGMNGTKWILIHSIPFSAYSVCWDSWTESAGLFPALWLGLVSERHQQEKSSWHLSISLRLLSELWELCPPAAISYW